MRLFQKEHLIYVMSANMDSVQDIWLIEPDFNEAVSEIETICKAMKKDGTKITIHVYRHHRDQNHLIESTGFTPEELIEKIQSNYDY